MLSQGNGQTVRTQTIDAVSGGEDVSVVDE